MNDFIRLTSRQDIVGLILPIIHGDSTVFSPSNTL